MMNNDDLKSLLSLKAILHFHNEFSRRIKKNVSPNSSKAITRREGLQMKLEVIQNLEE
jgi:hypothetical protein